MRMANPHTPTPYPPQMTGRELNRHRVNIALRVLNALAVHVPVSPDDSSQLRSWAEPGQRDSSLDNLALGVLQGVLNRDKSKRRRNGTRQRSVNAHGITLVVS